MKNTLIKLTSALGAAAFLIALPAFADQPGKGWDNFSAGAGEAIAVHQSATQASGGMPGKGWDNFSAGAGEAIVVRQSATQASGGMPGKGWDTYWGGAAGEPIRVSRATSQ